MPTFAWILAGITGYFVVVVPLAILLGRLLGRRSEQLGDDADAGSAVGALAAVPDAVAGPATT